jgi:glutaredoxin 3
MPEITMYTTRWCARRRLGGAAYRAAGLGPDARFRSVRAKILLDSLGLPYEEISLDDDPHFRQHLLDLTGGWTVPQIVLDGEPIGGYVELWKLDREGKLVA